MKLNHLSITAVDMLNRCPKQYYYRYGLGLKIPPGVAMLFGSVYHHTLEENFRYKILNKKDLPVESAETIFSDQFDRDLQEVNWLHETEKPGPLKDMGVGLVENYIQRVAPKRNPVVVEHEFRINVKGVGVPLFGKMDFVDSDGRIVEHKTASRKWPQSRADDSLQADGYALAYSYLFGSMPTEIIYDVAVKDSYRAIQTLFTNRDRRNLDEFTERLVDAEKMIEAEIFPRTDSGSWVCNPAFCGYYPHCKQGVPLSGINIIQGDFIKEYTI